MRKAILATTCIAVIAVSMAVGVSQSDRIKGWFSSAELYKNRPAAESAASSEAPPGSLAAATVTTPAPEETTVTDMAEAATAQEETAPAAAPAATPVDLSNTNLNDQTPASGKEEAAVPAEALKAEAAAETETAAASTSDFVVDVKKSLENRTLGSPDAPLTVHDYSSLSCPHCAQFHKDVLPKIKANYIDAGKVRWVFHSFPLSEAALKADMVARCAPGDQYFKLREFIFDNQERWAYSENPVANLNLILKIAGITDDVFLACANNKELEEGLIKDAQDASTKYKINSTPSFVFNDGLKVFSGAGSYEGFAYDLDRALKDLQPKSTPVTLPDDTKASSTKE